MKLFCFRAAEAEPGINMSYEVVMGTSNGEDHRLRLLLSFLDRGELLELI